MDLNLWLKIEIVEFWASLSSGSLEMPQPIGGAECLWKE